MTDFKRFVGIDWSGAKGAGQAGIAVAVWADGVARLASPQRPRRRWSRAAVVDYVAGLQPGTLVGLDFAFSLPWPEQGPFPDHLGQPGDPFELWAAVDAICSAEPHLYAGPMYRPAGGHLAAYMFTKLTGEPRWSGAAHDSARLRQTEMALTPRPNSVFKIVGAKTVGPGSFSGMRVLAELRRRLGDAVRVWPFEEADPERVTLCEIYPSAMYRWAGSQRSPVPDLVARVVRKLDAEIAADVVIGDQDKADALVSAAALACRSRKPGIFDLPADVLKAARREGWIFGVPATAPYPGSLE